MAMRAKLDECLAAVSILRRAVIGDADAQYRLWKLYKANRNDLALSEEDALHWLQVSAGQGHVKANFELGELYKNEIFPFASGAMDCALSFMKRLFGCLILVISALCAYATPQVSKVEAKQRYPWNGMVDITVTLSGSVEECSMVSTYSFCATHKETNAELPVRSVSPNGAISGSGNTWTRRFVWNATADVGMAKFGEVVLTVYPSIGVQLWENGPYWAECNVGATMPEECGYYFWWGDTVGYKRNATNDGWVSVKDGTAFSFSSENCSATNKGTSQLQSEGFIDAAGNLMAAHDAATAHLGASWRMPPPAELFALTLNCDTTWTTRGGVFGRLVTGRGEYASKSIFFPAAGRGEGSILYHTGSYGFYWSSTTNSGDSNEAWYLFFGTGNFERSNSYNRYGGRPVRPLRGFAK